MYVIGAQLIGMEPASGLYTSTTNVSLTSGHYYKFVFGAGETEIFPASYSGEIPVILTNQAQGGNGVACTASGGTLTVQCNYPGQGNGMLVEYADVLEADTDVRAYVTNWPDPQNVYVTNWPSTYAVTGTVSLSSDTIQSLASAIAGAIS